jgi:hypothetical protein
MKKKSVFFVFSFVMLGGVLMFSNSCAPDDTSDPVTVSDKIYYEQIGNALVKCYIDIYNQNLAGKPTGTQNITSTGPMGGTVIITGSDSYDNTHGITTTDLIFTMTNIQYFFTASSASGNTTATTQITISGATTYDGSFSDTYTSVNHQSQNLHIVGSVTYAGTVRPVDITGEVIINRSSKITVTILGNTVSW